MNGHPQKHILVAVSGNTPQIVTETLYALMVKDTPTTPISAVYIVTTARGAEIAWKRLGGPEGAIARFCHEYGFAPDSIAFKPSHILTIRRTDRGTQKGEALDDIRTSGDNELLASQLLGFIKGLTKDPHTVLHCSMGGGRRTMSAFMMLAMMLYGREPDRLTHVLVQEEFESNPDFFFPPKQNETIGVLYADRKPGVAQTKDANIVLADIPFVRLRPLLGRQIKKVEHSLKELIEIAQSKIVDLGESQPEQLVIDLKKREVKFGRQFIGLTGIRLALFAYYADTKVSHCVEPERAYCEDCRSCYQRPQEMDMRRFLGVYERVFAHTPAQFEEEVSKYRRAGYISPENLQSYHNKINKESRQVSPLLVIDKKRQYGNTRYGLPIDKTRIKINR